MLGICRLHTADFACTRTSSAAPTISIEAWNIPVQDLLYDSELLLPILLYLLSTQWQIELRDTIPQSLSLNHCSLFTLPPFGVLMLSLFNPRTRFTRMNTSPPSSLTAAQRSPLLTAISTLLRPCRSTNSRPSVLFPRQGMSLYLHLRV